MRIYPESAFSLPGPKSDLQSYNLKAWVRVSRKSGMILNPHFTPAPLSAQSNILPKGPRKKHLLITTSHSHPRSIPMDYPKVTHLWRRYNATHITSQQESKKTVVKKLILTVVIAPPHSNSSTTFPFVRHIPTPLPET